MKILHVADLHLSLNEQEYCLSVLEEIVALAALEQVGLLLLAGDVFDTLDDAAALRGEFEARLEALPADCSAIYVPGNHEALGANAQRRLGLFSFGKRVTVASDAQLLPVSPEVELLLIPHRVRFDDYQAWKIPPKQATYRIAVAHGTVAGLAFLGPEAQEDEAEAGGIIDPDLFSFHRVDYAAMGHLHAGRTARPSPDLFVAYPGSARVWRRGEAGPRHALLLDLAVGVEPQEVALASAGQWRSIELAIAQDGTVDVGPAVAAAAKEDWLEVVLSGVVDDDTRRDEAVRTVTRALKDRVRRLDVLAPPEKVLVLDGISGNKVVRSFLDVWARRLAESPEPDRAAWHRARDIGLRRIVSVVGAQS
jgi:exonuclease SbcD